MDALLTALHIIQQIDAEMFMQVYQWRRPFLDKIMPFITHLGSGGVLWLTCALLMYITGSEQKKRAALLTVVALTFSYFLSQELLKNVIERERPYLVLAGIKTLVQPLDSYSFPSGHTATSFACAVVLAKSWRRFKWLPVFLALAIGFSRVYVGVHYPLDVIAGAVLGIICGQLVVHWRCFQLPLSFLFAAVNGRSSHR
ncbi:undecaprenyl-diphosphatase [Desulfohalotomaculum tongense]|uniref:phosphatase PAP2 family protein n=1 Tax=Desulforadius tongensis TaxID=1216062 RepID=UPI001958AA2B|nr:phosphatase PAP2 family protein [Desulforadius tongensis]MBM7855046.1 undecaprenyl-diphosphatase [Desulforadius tongensis]